MNRSYTTLLSFDSFIDRYNYLKLNSSVGEVTFGFDRYLNQLLYNSKEWKRIRDFVLIRDKGWDLGLIDGFEITGKILVHHMNPISREQIEYKDKSILDPEYLISVSHYTHLAIHYGDETLLPKPLVFREPGDTSPWLKKAQRNE